MSDLRYRLLSKPTHLRELASGLRSNPTPVFHELAEILEACAWRIETSEKQLEELKQCNAVLEQQANPEAFLR